MATIRNYSPEEAGKRFESLPQDIKDAIYSAEMDQALTAVGEKFHLHFDQLSILEGEITGVMLGFTEPQDFPGIVAERLSVSKEIADGVAQELDTMLFQKIRESLKKITSSSSITPQTSAPPAVQAVPHMSASVPQSSAKEDFEIIPGGPAPQDRAFSAANMPKGVSADKPTITLSVPTTSLPKTVDIPSSQNPAAPAPTYKTDPYREPVE